MGTVRFIRRDTGYVVTFAYDRTLVDALKATVPSYARQWDATRREWWLEAQWAAEFAATVRELGGTVVGLGTRSGDPAQWARMLFSRVGPARSAAVYRALSRCLHPDTPTGDKQLQQELNDAHSAIEKD